MIHSSEYDIVDKIISEIGPEIRLATPLGVGKANHILNAFYQRAKENSNLKLKIYTALTLAKPKGKSLLEKNFLGPFAERVFGDYPDLDYEADRAKGQLPDNVEVFEFYFLAGKQMNNRGAQERYISSNYTHVARDLLDARVNVLAQLVVPGPSETYSLSCNPDVTLDMLKTLQTKKPYPFAFIGQINTQLPYMYGDAIIEKSDFDYLLENPDYNFKIFAPPKMSVPDVDHLIGLYASTLIKDGGELQVGIGSLGDALVAALLERQQNNSQYLDLLKKFNIQEKFGSIISSLGSTEIFKEGLFGATEMLVDGFMHLFDAGILKKKVYDHVILQRLLNEGLVTTQVTKEMFYLLLDRRAIHPEITSKDFRFLQNFGIFKSELSYEDGYILLPGGERIEADLNGDENAQKIISHCLGSELKNGAIIHGGFFLGPQSFYDWIKGLDEKDLQSIHMKSVTKINQLYGHEELDRLHRKNARFINTCLKMTLSGSAVSDGLEDGRVISGVGGQYNFVAMAHALPDGHSVIQLRSTRMEKGDVVSNIVFNYGHCTIPRHLRDIVVTEYGIADLRGKTDGEVAARLIEIADSRFQEGLIYYAKEAGKLPQSYQVPREFQNNFPETLHQKISELRREGRLDNLRLFSSFPFGTDFTEEEIVLGKALKRLKKKAGSKVTLFFNVLASLFSGPNEKNKAYLNRMGLATTRSLAEKVSQKLLARELNKIIK